MIFEQSFLELKRSLRHSSRRSWAWIYLVFTQIYVVYAVSSSLRLSNFLDDEDVIITMTKIILYVHIFGLPSFILINSYDNFVQDPALKLFAVISPRRIDLLINKLLAICIYSISIYVINLTISFSILSFYYWNNLVLKIFIKSLFAFIVITLFYVLSITGVIVTTRIFSHDVVSPIFLPLAIYYIIPFLISNALTFSVLNPSILNLSPTIWVIDFIGYGIYDSPFQLKLLTLPILIIICFILTHYAFNKNEFE